MAEGVADATVLIYLGKLDRLEWLRKSYGALLLPKAVFEEVVTEGKARNQPDALLVEQAIREGWMRVEPSVAARRPLHGLGLDKGDVEVLALALDRERCDLRTDDKGLRAVARAMGVHTRGTLSFLLQAVAEGDLSFDDYLATLERLTLCGFRLHAEVYARAVRLGRELGGKG